MCIKTITWIYNFLLQYPRCFEMVTFTLVRGVKLAARRSDASHRPHPPLLREGEAIAKCHVTGLIPVTLVNCSSLTIGFYFLQDILREGDTDHDGELNFEEFAQYLQERERKLLLMFHSLDRNNDGRKLPQILVWLPFCLSLKWSQLFFKLFSSLTCSAWFIIVPFSSFFPL